MNLWLRHPLKMLGFKFWALVYEVSQVYVDPPELVEEE